MADAIDDVPEPSPSAESGETADDFRSNIDDDWQRMSANLASRTPLPREPRANARNGRAEDDDVDPLFSQRRRREHGEYAEEEEGPLCSRTCWIVFASVLVALLALAAHQAYAYLNPSPLSLELTVVRPSKFKIDVTEFWRPRVSAAMQLVLQVRNSNLFRGLVLESCKLTAFEAATGLKLASNVHERPMLVSPRNSVQVTVPLTSVGGSLPDVEQRRLAALFLGEKALLLTLVATATSRLNVKGAPSKPVTTNSSRRVDLAPLTKEPFFQRAPPPPPPPPTADEVHDVP